MHRSVDGGLEESNLRDGLESLRESTDELTSELVGMNDASNFSTERPASAALIKPKRNRSRRNSGSRLIRNLSRSVAGSIATMPTSIKDEPMSQAQFDNAHGWQVRKKPTLLAKTKRTFVRCRCTSQYLKHFVFGVFPFFTILRGYKPRTDLLRDLIAGLTVCVMHIPQGMAYGMLAGLDPVYGLYSSLFPVAVYFLFGTSRHISFGTNAITSLMVSSTITRLLQVENLPGFVSVVHGTMGNYSTANYTLSESESGNWTDWQSSNQTSVSAAPSSIASVNGCGSRSGRPLSDSEWVVIGGREMSVKELRVEIAIAITLLTGLFQISLSLLRLGFLTIYLSDSLISGFTTGGAIHVASSQLQSILGYRVPSYSGPFNLLYKYIAFVKNYYKFNPISFGVAAVCIVIIAVFKEKVQPLINKRWKFPFPIDLLVIIIATAISYLVNLNSYGVMIVGKVPAGIPPPRVPDVRFFPDMAKDCVLLGIIGYATTISMASIMARKHNYEVRSNQEFLACGMSNTVASFFNCHTTATSLSRSMIQDGAGCKTQITGLISCVCIFLVLLVVAPLFESVPRCVLAAIIVVALKGLFIQFTELSKLWKTSKYDFAIWIVTFVATVLLDVDLGLICGFVFSVFTIMLRTQAPNTCELARIRHTTLYKNVSAYNDTVKVAGVKVIRFDGALYFASRDHLRSALAHKTGVNPATELRKRKHKPNDVKSNGTETVQVALTSHKAEINERVTHIVIDCTSITFVDTAGMQILSQIIDEYKAVGVRVLLAGPHANVREMFNKMDFYEKHSKDIVLVTTHDAVLEALKEQQVPPENAVDFGQALAGVPRDTDDEAAEETQAATADNNNNGAMQGGQSAHPIG